MSETIRLIDLEGLNQEACSVRMNVATTVQMIYNDARKNWQKPLCMQGPSLKGAITKYVVILRTTL
jgi:predicted DNA-binding protein (UPF0251 family)